MVISIVACPSRSCTAFSGTPRMTRCDANVWRSVLVAPHEFVVKGRINKTWWWDGEMSLWRSHPGRGSRLARSSADDTARDLRDYYSARDKDVVVEPAPPPGAALPPGIAVSMTKRLGIHIG